MFEIKKVAARDTFDCMLKAADGKPLMGDDGAQLSVTVYGPGSKQFQKAKVTQQARILAMMKESGGTALTPDEQSSDAAMFLADCTVSLNGFCYDGKSDAGAAQSLYSDHSLDYITDQVKNGIVSWQNFTGSSQKS